MLLESDSWAVSARRPAKSWVFSTLRQFLSILISQLSKNPEFEHGLFQQILWKNVQMDKLNACTVMEPFLQISWKYQFDFDKSWCDCIVFRKSSKLLEVVLSKELE